MVGTVFRYTFDLSSGKKFMTFELESGEGYIVVHELTWTIYGNYILNITVECNVKKIFLVTAKLSSPGYNTLKTSSLLINSRANLNFLNLNFLTSDLWTCNISVRPHLQLQGVQESATSGPVMTPGKRGVVRWTKPEQLSADMQRILSTGDLSDVILRNGMNNIRAHKVILSARSPVFAKMFHHPMKENIENCITISDITEEALKELVSFIYTGNVTLKNAETARNLYIAADKYAVSDLRGLCSDAMQSVSFEDVLDTLVLADLYEDKTLKHSALDFISKNYSLMRNSKNWEGFMKEHQALAIETLHFVIENKASKMW